jgi:hypothetical protein
VLAVEVGMPNPWGMLGQCDAGFIMWLHDDDSIRWS